MVKTFPNPFNVESKLNKGKSAKVEKPPNVSSPPKQQTQPETPSKELGSATKAKPDDQIKPAPSVKEAAVKTAGPSFAETQAQSPHNPHALLPWTQLESEAATCFFSGITAKGSPSLTNIARLCAHYVTVDPEKKRLVIGIDTLLAAYLFAGVKGKALLPQGDTPTWLVEWALTKTTRSELEAQLELRRSRDNDIVESRTDGAVFSTDVSTENVIRTAGTYLPLVNPGHPGPSARHVFAAMLNSPGFDALLSSELGTRITSSEINDLRRFFLRKLKVKPAAREIADKWDDIVLQPNVSDGNQTMGMQISALLEALNIPVVEPVPSLLLNATAYEGGTEAIEPHAVLAAMLTWGQNSPNSPLGMLSQVGSVSLETVRPPLKTDDPVGPNPVRFSSDVESLLRRGFKTQQEIFLNPALGTQGLVAGILTTPFYKREAQFNHYKIAFDDMPSRFRDVVRDRLAGRPAELRDWYRALELETATLPKLNHDQPGQGQAHDKLGITNDALAIANVAAGADTNLPLAFGIFGDWGAGKTFFMRLIQDQIGGIVKSNVANDGFEHKIVQIEFNAWHYAETNLWASLVGHIFDELDRWMTRGKGGAKAADQILQRLATSRRLTLEAAAELVMRRKEHAKAEADLSEAEETLAKARVAAVHSAGFAWRTAFDAVRQEIMSDVELQQQLGAIADASGVPKVLGDKAKLTAALDELNRSASAGNAALGALRATVGNPSTVIVALSVLVVVPLFLFGLHAGLAAVTGWAGLAEMGTGLEALGGLLAMLAVLTENFSRRVKSLGDKFARLRRSVDVQITKATQEELDDVEEAAIGLTKSAAKVERAKTLVQATGDQVAAALKEYEEETGALRIRRFIRARAGADGYGKHLGLVSTIRKDFEQLESLMLNVEAPPHLEEVRLHYVARVEALIIENENSLEDAEIKQLRDTATSPRDLTIELEEIRFNRIVLYIDDLDRCEPDKVVEILQAVNMLLSFRLFVVMVAVDARWLSRSLEKRYPDFFGRMEVADDEPKDVRSTSVHGEAERPLAEPVSSATVEATSKDRKKAPRKGDRTDERATAADYLEKIFQIPYWVPSMNAKASISLVRDLVAPDQIVDEIGPISSESPPPKEGPGEENGGGLNDVKKEPPIEEVVQVRGDATPPRSLGLTKEEITTLTALSPFLGGSPRRARRFVNVYRVAKASLTPAEIKKLEETEHRALATQLAVATSAPNSFGTWMRICKGADDTLLAELVSDEFDRRNIEGALNAFQAMPNEGSHALVKLAAQSSRAARFSFAVPSRQSQDAISPSE